MLACVCVYQQSRGAVPALDSRAKIDHNITIVGDVGVCVAKISLPLKLPIIYFMRLCECQMKTKGTRRAVREIGQTVPYIFEHHKYNICYLIV